MARAKSVVLTKDEKKQLSANLRTQLKDAKNAVKALEGVGKEATKTLAAATKAHGIAVKANEKALAAAQKDVEKLEGQLAAVLEPKQ